MSLQLGDRVHVSKSAHPSAGKTCQIRTEAARNLLYCCVRVTTIANLRDQLSKVDAERGGAAPDRGLALHLNVAHNAAFADFNEFLFTLCFLGLWSDSDGSVHRWHPLDALFIEVPSEGRPGDNWSLRDLPICQALKPREPPAELRFQLPRLEALRPPDADAAQYSLLHTVTLEDASDLRRAAQWLSTLNSTKDTRVWPAPGFAYPAINQLNVLATVAEAIYDAGLNWAPLRHG